MARFAEIVAVTRRGVCDARGHARLVFTITNVHGRLLRIHLEISAEAPIDSAWLLLAGGSERSLGPKASDQIIVDARFPPHVPVGDYRLRLVVSDAAQRQAGCDTSASVLLRVTQPLVADPAKQPASPESIPEHAASKHRLSWAWLAGFFRLLGSLLRRLLAPFSNWFWGGRSSAERVVDTGIVKKALVLIAVVYGLSLASSIHSMVSTPDSCGKISEPGPTDEQKECLLRETWLYPLVEPLSSDPNDRPQDQGFRSLCELIKGLTS